MSAFIPSGGPAAPDTDIPNLPFFPAFTSGDFRLRMRVPDSLPEERLIEELTRAILATNRELHPWRNEQEAAGHASLGDVPADEYGGTSELEFHYRFSVYHRAKAFLIEKGRDYDATAEGLSQAEGLEINIEDHFRAVREHLAALMDKPRANVELI
jgi:hypothetical protein